MIGIICAMEEEVVGLEKDLINPKEEIISKMRFNDGKYGGKKCVVAKSGVGKVHAAMCAQTMILKYNPDYILNVGMAGAVGENIEIFNIVIAKEVVQHDYDISVFGDKRRGQISGFNFRDIKCSEKIVGIAKEVSDELKIKSAVGRVLTADSFISDEEKVNELRCEFDGLACEMEGASIGQVCNLNGVEFGVIKIISDKAEKYSKNEFKEFSKKYPQIINNLIKKIVSKL